jgi:hypothetical protein
MACKLILKTANALVIGHRREKTPNVNWVLTDLISCNDQ